MRVFSPLLSSPPLFLSFLPLLSSSLLPLVSWGGCGRGVGTPIITYGSPPSAPQKTPQQWRLQGVAKRLSRQPPEGIVEHSGLENDIKMRFQRDHFRDFCRVRLKSDCDALATVSARFSRSEGTRKCCQIEHKSLQTRGQQKI